jgi:phage/plasmid-associated DNA primase
VKVNKDIKRYVIKQIHERGILQHIFNGIQIINPMEKVLDPNSASFPAMLLGSMKRGGKIPHEFYRLYQVQIRAGISPLIQVKNDFDGTPGGPPVKVPDPRDRRRKIEKVPPAKYKYNLVYETSLIYEDPNGLIKKRAFDAKKEIADQIRANAERTRDDLIPKNELEEVRNHVQDLIVRNYEAKYLQKILDIISPARVASYDDWKAIIVMLAKANPDYKPLAIWFSHRCPQSWVKNGLQTLEGLWQWAVTLRGDEPGEDGKPRRTINTLYAWAKEDNPEKYNEIQDCNAFIKIKNIAMESCGLLHETHIAEVLKTMFGKKFVCDESVHSTARSRERHWYEFVFPDDEVGRTKGSLYKWRREKYPDNLDKYVSKKLPLYIKKIGEWVDNKIQQGSGEEEVQRFYETMKKNLRMTSHSLGKKNMITNIVSRCEIEFRDRGFEETLDTDPNVIGVGNGVLRVYPKTELIQRYHEIPISRSMEVDYEPYNPDNPYVQVLERELRRLFAGEEDAFTYTMCYLGSSLDGRKKNPLFFIWLGEGSNGKSFLLELHINTLHKVVKGGYGAKLNVAFFTQERKGAGGPDSEKMMLKYSRFAYCSESNEGEVLIMSKIKEFTSETLSGNEKHQTQDMFEANCHYVFCSNNDPRVTGRDYGTWRRLLVYRFKMMFIDNPNPKNKYEYKRDPKFINIVTKDPNYKKAYLSILMRYYEMYRDKYNCDLNNIPKPTIDKETRTFQNEQDTISRFISEQIVHLGKEVPDTADGGKMKKVRDINLVDVANRFIAWHVAKIDDRRPIRSEVLKALRSTSLKNFIIDKFTGAYLTEHRILEVGEDYDAAKNNEEEKAGDVAKEVAAEADAEAEDGMIDDLDGLECQAPEKKSVDNIVQDDENIIDDLE